MSTLRVLAVNLRLSVIVVVKESASVTHCALTATTVASRNKLGTMEGSQWLGTSKGKGEQTCHENGTRLVLILMAAVPEIEE